MSLSSLGSPDCLSNQLFELRVTLNPLHHCAIEEKRRNRAYLRYLPFQQVPENLVADFAVEHVLAKPLHVQLDLGGVFEEERQRIRNIHPFILPRKQQFVHLPELELLARRLGGL